MHCVYDISNGTMPVIDVRLHGDTPMPVQTDVGDWIDLCAAEDVDMVAGEYRKISLGISMKLPDGYEAHIAPRSSTFEKWGILQTNSMGVIDHTYCGDNDIWRFPALAMRPTKIRKGDRICQFRIEKRMRNVALRQVDKQTGEDRGGFGSTGSR